MNVVPTAQILNMPYSEGSVIPDCLNAELIEIQFENIDYYGDATSLIRASCVELKIRNFQATNVNVNSFAEILTYGIPPSLIEVLVSETVTNSFATIGALITISDGFAKNVKSAEGVFKFTKGQIS